MEHTGYIHTHISEDGTVYEHVHEVHEEETSSANDLSFDLETDAPHVHVAPDGTVYEHVHTHTHAHTHQNTKAVINRLSRAIGHLESVKRMVEDGRDCSEVLIQLSAVRSALNNTAKVILKDHIEHCMVDAAMSGDREAIEELTQAIDTFMK